ncbi:MAG TPA: 4Fe-4S double cluster binding domain-containing protein, partial [Ignavibacteria bacterium]|nr:4Fe-4S double cluster binding domain-containing protein [Ignavibacteria bacterium]
ISACPTGAIESEYIVNANKCISYQTIENRGEIPESINLDGWIFGCDVCQDVCPYNSPKYNHVTEEKGFWPKEVCLPLLKGEWPEAEGILSTQTSPNPLTEKPVHRLSKEGAIELTEEQFVEIFIDSPIKRTKFTGWKRNLERIDG